MQISKSSWHYRFTNFFISGFERKCKLGQHTTCSYIRAVFYAICACLLAVAFFGSAAVMAAAVVGSMISVPVMIFCFSLVAIPKVMVFMATMGWLVVAAGLFIYTLNFVIKHASEYSERRHSLMIQAMQDKKDGVCTIVRIQD